MALSGSRFPCGSSKYNIYIYHGNINTTAFLSQVAVAMWSTYFRTIRRTLASSVIINAADVASGWMLITCRPPHKNKPINASFSCAFLSQTTPFLSITSCSFQQNQSWRHSRHEKESNHLGSNFHNNVGGLQALIGATTMGYAQTLAVQRLRIWVAACCGTTCALTRGWMISLMYFSTCNWISGFIGAELASVGFLDLLASSRALPAWLWLRSLASVRWLPA